MNHLPAAFGRESGGFRVASAWAAVPRDVQARRACLKSFQVRRTTLDVSPVAVDTCLACFVRPARADRHGAMVLARGASRPSCLARCLSGTPASRAHLRSSSVHALPTARDRDRAGHVIQRPRPRKARHAHPSFDLALGEAGDGCAAIRASAPANRLPASTAGVDLHPDFQVHALAARAGQDVSFTREAVAPRHGLASRRHSPLDRRAGIERQWLTNSLGRTRHGMTSHVPRWHSGTQWCAMFFARHQFGR
jgi:hypothetical protein